MKRFEGKDVLVTGVTEKRLDAVRRALPGVLALHNDAGAPDSAPPSWRRCRCAASARPQEVAAVAAFLLAGEASFATGSEYVVDGGMSEL